VISNNMIILEGCPTEYFGLWVQTRFRKMNVTYSSETTRRHITENALAPRNVVRTSNINIQGLHATRVTWRLLFCWWYWRAPREKRENICYFL